jgi:nucleotide-binding universal stress UspA family protein
MTTEQRDELSIDAGSPARALVVFEQTANGRAALSYAVERARREGAELTVLRTMPYDEVRMGCASCRHGAAIWNREMRYDAEEALCEAREVVGDDASVTYAIAKGQGAREIALAARLAQADLIVLSSRRSPRLPRLGFDSLADRARRLGAWDVAVAPAAHGSEAGPRRAAAAEWRRLRRAGAFFIACLVLLVALTAIGFYH